jgi:hypothetical protein
VRKNKVPKKTPTWAKEKKKKGQLEFTTLVSLGTRRDKKDAPINAPCIHIGALVGASSL